MSEPRIGNIVLDYGDCEHCLRDPEIGPQLRSLPFFLPLPSNVEELPYTYLFVAMEPSRNWLKTETEGRRRVSEGYVNFATQLNDYILVFAVQKYLLREGRASTSRIWGSAPCLRVTSARGRAGGGTSSACVGKGGNGELLGSADSDRH